MDYPGKGPTGHGGKSPTGHDFTHWMLNSNSGDTGGIPEADLTTVDGARQAYPASV